LGSGRSGCGAAPGPDHRRSDLSSVKRNFRGRSGRGLAWCVGTPWRRMVHALQCSSAIARKGVLMPSEVPTISGDHSVEELRRELAEAREQQATTAEILRVISSASDGPATCARGDALTRRSIRWKATSSPSLLTMGRLLPPVRFL